MTTSSTAGPPGALLTPREVAAAFRVDVNTVRNWARSGKIPHLRTPGGDLRFRESDIRALRDFGGQDA